MAGKQTQLNSFKVAFCGIGRAFRDELHMKVHAAVAVLALAACAVLRVELWGWCVVLVCIGAVFAAEIVNTALEALCDAVHPDYDPLIGKAKDAAAGAVLVLAIASVAAGLVVYVPALLRLLA